MTFVNWIYLIFVNIRLYINPQCMKIFFSVILKRETKKIRTEMPFDYRF